MVDLVQAFEKYMAPGSIGRIWETGNPRTRPESTTALHNGTKERLSLKLLMSLKDGATEDTLYNDKYVRHATSCHI